MPRNHWLLIGLLAAMLCAAGSGCVQRRLMVRSNPPGAQLYIDEQPIGKTPVSVPYIYYGTRNIRLEKDGYETLVTKHNVVPPWYQIPPVDFVSENIYPYEVRDERVIDFQLQPLQIVPTGELMNRAEGLRRSVSQGFSTPLPGIAPTSGPMVPSGAPLAPPAGGAFGPGGSPFGPPPP